LQPGGIAYNGRFQIGSAMFAGRSSLYVDLDAMPKLKTHKGTKKRFRITANGKVKHRRAGTSHLNSHLTKKQRRNLRGTGVLNELETKKIHRLLGPYSY
jgi:large subunit ribosomal protein L35